MIKKKFNRNIFIKLLGPKTKKINPKPTSVILKKFKTHKIEKIKYYVEKNERITGYLLTPVPLNKKLPLIICHHQHASNYLQGKSEISGLKGNKNLHYGKELAKMGFATFVPDAIAFEDRNFLNKNWWGVEYYELASRILQGKTLLEKNLSDLSIALDFLVKKKFIDRRKIGFLGHSFGARMAVLFPAYDKRVKVSVSNCWCLNYKNSLNTKYKTRIPMEMVVPNILKYCDYSDIVKLVHPCHLFISSAKNDKWSRDAIDVYKKVKKSFTKSELKFKIWNGGHRFSKKMRMEAYKFLDRKLGG